MSDRKRGSAFITVIIATVILTGLCGAVFTSMSQNNRLVERNSLRARAKAVADSELERMYYKMTHLLAHGVNATDVPAAMGSATMMGGADFVCDYSTTASILPTTARKPFLEYHRNENNGTGWIVFRSIELGEQYTGSMPDEASLTGHMTTLTARVRVRPPNSSTAADAFTNSGSYWTAAEAETKNLAYMEVRVGRHFMAQEVPPPQNLVSADGDDMEFNPSTVILNGPVASNDSIYMGSTLADKLIVNNYVRYYKGDVGSPNYFNKTSDGVIVYRKPGTVGGTPYPPKWADSEASQVEQLRNRVKLVPVNNAVLSVNRPDLFKNDNDVQRALIVPPPSETDEYPGYDIAAGDDPVVSTVRVYNQAGIIITVNKSGDGMVDVSVNTTNGTSTSVIADVRAAVSASTYNMWDYREGRVVKTVNIDIQALKTVLNKDNFNGVLYINQYKGSSANPAAVILTNASSLPDLGTKGMTIATNGGMYLRGSYNTELRASDGKANAAALLADAVTLLSEGFSPTAAASPLPSRKGTLNSKLSLDGTVKNNEYAIRAMIMTGNTPATATDASGGLQNLIRFMEDFYNVDVNLNGIDDEYGIDGLNVQIYGSLNRVFSSAWYTRPWQNSGSYYIQPRVRTWGWDSSLLDNWGPGIRSTLRQSRGAYFIW